MKTGLNLAPAVALALLSTTASVAAHDEEGAFEQVEQAPLELSPAVHTALGTITGASAEKYLYAMERLLTTAPQLFGDVAIETESHKLAIAIALSERTQVLRINSAYTYWDDNQYTDISVYEVQVIAYIAGEVKETFEVSIFGGPLVGCNAHPSVGSMYLMSLTEHQGAMWPSQYGQDFYVVNDGAIGVSGTSVSISALTDADLAVQ